MVKAVLATCDGMERLYPSLLSATPVSSLLIITRQTAASEEACWAQASSKGFSVGLVTVWLLLNTSQKRFTGKSRHCNGTGRAP